VGWEHHTDVVVELDVVVLWPTIKSHVPAVSALKVDHNILGLVNWSFELHSVNLVDINAALFHLSLDHSDFI
jgi:hypothetical protein